MSYYQSSAFKLQIESAAVFNSVYYYLVVLIKEKNIYFLPYFPWLKLISPIYFIYLMTQLN